MTSRPAAAVSQSDFTKAMMDAAQETPAGLRDSQNRSAGRRFDVYRNNVAVSLTEALMQAFPVITKLLGDENMKGLSGIYLRAQPPTSPVMMVYGATFAEFIAQMPQLGHLAYLPDVARLEQALRVSYHAADSAPFDSAALAALSPEQLMDATLSFAPSIQLLRSDWPIFDIWRFNTEPDAPKPTAGAQDVLITRPEFDPQPCLLPKGGADWITALMNGHSIGQAFEITCQKTDNFDLTATLALLLNGGALTVLDKKD